VQSLLVVDSLGGEKFSALILAGGGIGVGKEV